MLKLRKAATAEGVPVTVIELTGSLDANFADELRGEVEKLDASAGGTYAIGFEGVGYICSRVLGSLLSFRNNLREAGGHVVLFGVSESVQSVMEIVEFHSFFRLCKDEAEALAVLGGTIPEMATPAKLARRTWLLIGVFVAAVAVAAVLGLIFIRWVDGLF